MDTNLFTGLSLIIFAGICSGTFAIPFKLNQGWKWENNWFIWSFIALIVTPWIVAWLTIPDMGSLYAKESYSTAIVAFFGLIWGIGSILFGKGIDYLGISLSLPIMQGLINTVGTLTPILLRNPAELTTPSGIQIMTGIVILLIGIILFAIAGKRKEQVQNKTQQETISKSRFGKGLIICLLAGVFGPMINFAFVYGKPLQDRAVEMGAEPVYAGNIIWSIALTAGFLINAAECIRLFFRNNSWNNYTLNPSRSIVWAAIAGIIWYLSIMLYGMGGNQMGSSGASIGWAVMQSVAIIAGNIAGICAGEWRGATRHARSPMIAGLFFLIAGIIILSVVI